MGTSLITPIAILVLLIVLLITLIALAVRIIKSILKKNVSDTAVTHNSRLVATGIVAFTFSHTLYLTLVYPMIMLFENVNYLADFLMYNSSPSQRYADILNPSNIGNSFVNFLSNLPLGRIFLAIATGVVVYQFVKYLFLEIGEPSVQPPAVPRTGNALVYNLMIVAILGFSLFLVISVFISIPYLNDLKKPALFTKTNLDSALNGIRVLDSMSTTNNLTQSPIPNNSLEDSLLKDPGVSAVYMKLSSTDRDAVKSISDSFKNINLRRSQALDAINKQVVEFNSAKLSVMRDLSDEYIKNSLSNSVNKDELFTSIIHVYRRYIQGFRTSLTQTYYQVEASDRNNLAEYQRTFNQIRNSISNVDTSNAAIAPVFSSNPYLIAPQFSSYNYNELQGAVNETPYVEVSKRDGSDWGIFGLVSRYLIKTESLDLVLLIGMLGFGLLGASVSSFQNVKITTLPAINPPENNPLANNLPSNVPANNASANVPPAENPEANNVPPVESISDSGQFIDTFKTKPIIKDFWGVLARGFSAAILIYLATKGGIAILTTSTSSDPNGYILLFMCFVGAVFSEKVWASVKTKYGL
jgi:hypothetical protein